MKVHEAHGRSEVMSKHGLEQCSLLGFATPVNDHTKRHKSDQDTGKSMLELHYNFLYVHNEFN